MDVTLKQLRYFAVVAEQLNFTRAAELLHVSQPALSVQIRSLERALGVELLRRSSRSVELTETGRRFHDDITAVLDGLDRAVAHARRDRGADASPIRLTYTASTAYDALPRILDRLADGPSPDVLTSRAWSVQALEDVRSGATDIVLMREFPGEPGLVTEVIRREPLAAFMSTGHHLAGRGDLAVDDLRDETILVVPADLAPGFHGLAARLCTARGFTPTQVVLSRPESREPLLAHLRRHPGELFLGPVSMASLTWEGVTHLPIRDPDARIDICLVTNADATSSVVEDAVTVIRELARSEGWLEDSAV